jgi:hypothetical protein
MTEPTLPLIELPQKQDDGDLPMTRRIRASLSVSTTGAGATRHLRVRARSATGRVAEAASY